MPAQEMHGTLAALRAFHEKAFVKETDLAVCALPFPVSVLLPFALFLVGCHARCMLVSDSVLPSDYRTHW